VARSPRPLLSVDIVSDVMCPWCIIGWLKFEKVIAHFAGRLDFRVQWHPFELNPDMPPEGEDAVEHVIRKYGITPDQSRTNRDRLAGIAADLDFAFNRDRVSECATASMRIAC
jgi:Predicted dithiol-disulfide isomerase involved in polyketide biosynthesis